MIGQLHVVFCFFSRSTYPNGLGCYQPVWSLSIDSSKRLLYHTVPDISIYFNIFQPFVNLETRMILMGAAYSWILMMFEYVWISLMLLKFDDFCWILSNISPRQKSMRCHSAVPGPGAHLRRTFLVSAAHRQGAKISLPLGNMRIHMFWT